MSYCIPYFLFSFDSPIFGGCYDYDNEADIFKMESGLTVADVFISCRLMFL